MLPAPQDAHSNVTDQISGTGLGPEPAEALSDEVTADTIIAKVLERIPVPTAPMQGHAAARA